MRVIRILSLVAVAGLLGLGNAACVSTVSGHATAASDLQSPGGLPTGTDSPTDTASPSGDPTPTDPPSPTPDPVKTKEQVTCVLVQATVKSTNDKFNAAKTRDTQVGILTGGRNGVQANLTKSGLAHSDRIYVLGSGIYNELRKLVSSAKAGGSPSTTPYNNATNKFRTACLSL
ncbi:MAG: hypothetical protein V7637_5227 [Mycobacteriales bacterium]|jgi:hypothetical protein